MPAYRANWLKVEKEDSLFEAHEVSTLRSATSIGCAGFIRIKVLPGNLTVEQVGLCSRPHLGCSFLRT